MGRRVLELRQPAIFDPLYRYDYLARPYRIVPNTAAALPEISPDGLTWTIRIKPGIYFADDPAFKGKKRELIAADYVYSWKRIARSEGPLANLQVFDQLFVGADAVVAKAKETGKFDYDAPIEGLQAIDRYTLRVKLTHPAYSLLSDLTTTPTAAVAREVIDAYGDASTLGDGESGRHRSVPAEGLAARPEDRARGESRLSRDAVSRERRSGGPRRSWRR